MLNVSPKDAKKDERLLSSGKLVGFNYNSMDFPLEPKTVFYDLIYINAVKYTFSLDESNRLQVIRILQILNSIRKRVLTLRLNQ